MRRGGSWEFAGGPDAVRPARGRILAPLSAAALCLTAACDRGGVTEGGTGADTTRVVAVDTMAVEPVVIGEIFLTERDTIDNVDSPAVWHGPEGEHWILTTAKDTDVMLVNDASTGALIRKIGGTGAAQGQLERPNGVAVVGNTMLVVERDNARIQAFSLPALESLGTFGEEQLVRPYGIAAYEVDGAIELYVTDNYEQSEDVIPPDSLLDERVEHFRVRVADGALEAEHVETFGETTGEGVLRKVETIGVDPANDRLLIAEELEPDSHWKIYRLDGTFTGDVHGRGYFPQEAEGLALYACDDGGGYWIATDQGEQTNTFHVFDRATLEHLGAFSGEVTRNTDGVALTQTAFGPFPAGAFYAIHNDGNIAAFSWAEIADSLELRSDCSR